METEPPPCNFSLKNLPGAAKIDVVARCILATFPEEEQYLVPRRFSVIFTKGQPTVLTVKERIAGNPNYDEIAIAAQIKEAMNTNNNVGETSSELEEEVEWAKTLCWVKIKNLDGYLQKLKEKDVQFIYLHEEGLPFKEELSSLLNDQNLLFILGGREDLSREREQILEELGTKKISLGNKSYLASSCISKILYEFEKMVE